MKKYYSFFLLLLCSITVLSLTSCLDDDSDSSSDNITLTTAQKVSAMYNSAGSYTGKIYFPKDAYSLDADSLETYLTMTPSFETGDTCQSISLSFPLESLKKYVYNSDSTILKEADPAELTAKAYLYSSQPEYYINQNTYTYLFMPNELSYTSGSNNITVSFSEQAISFANGAYYPYLFTMNNSALQTYILVKAVTINGNSYDVSRPFIVLAYK